MASRKQAPRKKSAPVKSAPGNQPSKEDSPSDLPADPLREELDKRLGPLIPPGKREEVVQVAVSFIEESFVGPIAHPKHLAEYERIAPGAAERIIRMAEKAQDHNMAMDETTVGASIADERRGLYLGAGILALLVIGAFVAATFFENNVGAGLLLTAAVLNVVAMMIRRTKS